jgi:hypothetical protein
MKTHRFNAMRLALVAVVGAVVLEVILTVSIGLGKAFTLDQVPSHLAALVVGGLGGWVFELMRELTTAAADAIETVTVLQASVAALTANITYQDAALGMLTRSPRHNAALTLLLQASMSDNFRNIPLIGVPKYLEFLKVAIEHSDGYEGVQRQPLRWYKVTGAGSYLVDLRKRDMSFKRRLFIVDDDQVEQMTEDLADDEILDYYWRNTGEVKSYWLTVSEFKRNFPGRRIPRDLALYDRQLLVAYDETNQLLSFDVVKAGSDVLDLFDAVPEMARHGVAVLKEIPDPGHGDAGRVGDADWDRVG